MRISRYLYEEECERAFGSKGQKALTVTERRVLDEITVDGWFDTGEYIKKVFPVHVTDNQKEIMSWCPLQDDDWEVAAAKNQHRQLIVKKMAKRTRYNF